MNLLVTGATSFLGSAVCRELLSRGHRVFAPVRKTSANLGALPDSPELRRIFVPMEEIGGLMQEGIPAPDACIHLRGAASVSGEGWIRRSRSRTFPGQWN